MKIFRGKVAGVKNKKTAIVEVARFFTHPLYLKRIRKTKRYSVHCDIGLKEGDIVDFAEIRPMSKTKRWRIVEVISKKQEAEKTEKQKNGETKKHPLRQRASKVARNKK